ncbi:conserved hypothetical protein [Vibrio chagasii]|nr:conserved hypothetical protein [Vibrio chagasii]
MAKNNNVETHKKNTRIENKKSSELKPKETTKKKKLRLHSHLRVNIPLFQSLMMILPSLAKHAEANEGSGDSTHDMDLAATTPVADETIVDKHAGASSFEATHPNTQTNESQESPNTNESQVPHGANTHLVPSHHLSTLSHPQVHYIPSVSMPTISAGGNGQPSHSNTPPTPTTPVTFIPEVIKGTYGELHVDVNGQYTFVLNPNSPQYILLNQHQQGTDHFALHLSNGASIVVQIPVTGKQDLPSISGDLTGVVTEDHNIDSQGLLHANGKIDVIDPDQDESSVTPEVISGKYGSLTIDADGHWQYQVDNSLSNVQALTGATSLHESFTIHTKDGTPQTIDMTIGGNDDNAVITGVDAGSVIEDLTTQVQGQLSVTDPDLGEDHFQASQVNGHFGTLTITKDGAWTYDLDNYNPYVQRLAQGSTATDIITVHSADGTAHQVTITINGTNDSAVITNNTGGSPNSFFVVGKSPHLDQVIEDHKLTVSGKLSISDIDAKEGHFSNTDVAGTLGTLHLKDNGAWTYDLDNTNPAVQALGKGSATTDIMTIHSADGTPHQITIIINGTNDKAVIGGTSSGAVTEETQLQTSGALTITDVDTGEAHFSNTDVVGTLGTLHLKDNGAWTYDLDNTNPKVQALGKGATATDTITVHSADGTQHQVAVTINGTNDRPTISGTSSGAVIEQGLSTAGNPDATGSLIATDIDTSDTITWAINQPQGQWGTLSIDQHGHWHYQLDNSTGGAADKLAAGEHQSESFWITATDSTGATVPHKIVIDVQGSNDKPIVSAWTQLPAGKEDQPVTIKASDLLTHASDVDSSDVLHVTNLQATHGSLIDNKDGTYTFTPDKDFNGEIRLTYDVVDGHGGSVSTQARFDLTAAPDNAIITDAQTNADLRGVTEDRGYIDTHYQLHYDGKLNIQDPDKGEAQFDPNIGSQTYQGIGYDTKLGGHILLMRDGHYTYTLDNRNIQNLAQGEVKHDSAVIRSADGTTHTIELTVHGTNDAPTINAQSHSVTEGGSVLNGQMVGQDIDTGAALTYSAPQIDGLVVNPDGSYSFNPAHSSYQSLASGVTKTLTVPVTVTDEHNASSTQNLSITITGVNNSAVIGGVDTGDVTEGNAGQDMSPDYAQPGMAHLVRSTIRASGKLSISDTDTGEAEFDTHGLGFNYSGQYGDLLLRKDGTWFYHADTGQIRSTGGLTSTRGTAIDQLGENQTLTDTITVYSKDGTSHDIVITIHGSNDRPYCASEVQLNSGKEDLAQTITATELLANTVDVDANDAGKLTIANLHADHGSIQDNHDGTFTFHPSQDYNGKVSFTYDVQDAHGGSTATSASMTLAPISDAAVITGSGSGVKEDFNVDISSGHLLGASGVFHVVDPDGPAQSQFPDVLYGGTYQGSHGGDLQVNSNGNYYYHISNYLVQHLSEGETLKEEYTIHSVDGTQHKVEFTVEGTNDKPVLSAQSQSVTEGGTLLSGQMHATDVDTKDTHTFTIDKPVDGLTFNNDGSYTFDPSHTSYQNLGANNNQVINVQVKVDDHNGGTDTKTLTLVVHGTNDVATIGGQDTFTVQEDHNLTLNSGNTIIYNGQLTITDADAGEDHFDENLHQNQQTGTWDTGYTTQEGGKLILQSNGSYRYEIDNSLAKIQSLGSSETLIDTVTVRSADGTSHQIQVTIQGDNDAPVVSSAVTLTAGTEDTDVVLHISDLLANATDIDHNDVGKLSVANLIADHGNITDNHDGTFTFHPSQDYNGKVSFTYDVQDAHGGSVSTSASITLAPTRDSAVISGDNTGTIIEDHNVGHSSLHPVAASGLLRVTDPDAGQDHFQVNRLLGEQAIHDPFGGFLRITPNGAWGYEVANSRLQSLAEGEVEKVVYRVYSADHTAHDITITVTGTNDRPTITATTLAHGTEDINYQMQASQFGFADVDTGDTMHSIAITDLPPAAQGKFLLDGHDITAGQSIIASDIAKLQFVPTPNFNGDVQFKFTVNDGHVDSQEATNTLHIDAVSDAAQFTGRDAGDVHEGHGYTAPDGSMSVGSVDDRSPDHTRGNIGKLWNDEIHTDGHLNIVDPDSGESHAQTGTYQGTHGHVILQSNGDWSYYASIGQDATGRKIDRLGQGESITDTVTVKSADGTTHDIHITIHGDNDRPYCSSEVQLNSGKEDLAQTITTTELLTNTVDVDTNDAGQLSIANLHADHGTLVDNKDGTFTFTPDHNFNGKVHFTYDIKDAHGGVTHTGASTTLLPSNDAATLQPTLASNFVTEDHLKSGTSTNELWSGWKNLDIQDIDSPSEAKVTQIEVNGVKHTVPANFAMNLAGAHGIFNFTHSTDGHDKWSYSADNSHAEVQSLSHGDSLTDTITLITTDGTRIPLTAKILGADDHVIIDTPDALTAALGTAVEDKVTSISGTLLAHDSDSKDSVTFTAGNSVGTYGTLHVDSNGQWHYDLDHSKANALQQGETKAEGFDITATSTDGSTATKHIEVLVQGSNDKATISVTSNPDVHEDSSSTPVEIISGKLSALDPDHDQSAFSTDVGKRHDPFNSGVHGGLHISTDGSWTYTVNNSQIQQLAAGQEEHVQYNVHTVGGDYHVIDIKIVGTNDIPTVSATTLVHGTEDTHYQMQASQFGFTDVDTGDTLHSIAITDLPPAAQGKFVLDGHDITAGQSISASDIAKLQFTPATDFNGDVQFKFTVNDGHASSAEATNTLHIDAVGDAATIAGVDTGGVTEDSFYGMQWLITKGQLTISDADTGEDKFDPMLHAQNNAGIGYDTKLGGHVLLSKDGSWQYNMDNFSPEVQKLAAGETAVDTVTVHSVDGTLHDIQITIHGTNDAPVLSVTQTTPTTGTLIETDVDVKDTHIFSVVSSTGQFGSLSVDPDSGAYVYTSNGSVAGMSYNTATHTYHGTDVFEVKVADNHGGESSKFITFDANGHVSVVPGQSPTISTSVPSNPLVTTTQPSLPTGTNTPPNNAVTVDLAATSDTGTSDTDNLTKDSTPTVTGHTDIPYSQVTIYDGSTPIGHAVSDGSGQYSVAVSSLSNGDHNLSAKALAPSSVLPATSSILSLHVDTVVAPLQISLTHDTGSNSSDLITSDGSLTINGQEAGATVEYSTDNGHTWTSSFTPQQGSNTVSVRQTDTAGNVSTETSVSFTLDNTVNAPTVSLSNDTGRHSINTPDLITKDSRLSIQTEAGAKVEYSNDGGHTWTAVFNPVEGVNDLQVRQTDIAGNVSPVTHFSFTLDTTPGTITVNPISQDNALNAAENNQPLVITGTTSNIAPGDVVYVVIGNKHFYDATVKPDGTWSLTLGTSIHQNIMATDRDYSIQVGTVDTAGNSTPRISTHLLVDTQSPIPHIAVDSVTQDNVLNALESGQTIAITGTVTGDYQTGDIVSLKINGATISSLTGSVDSSGHFSIPVAGNILEHANIHTSYANGQSGSIHSIEATIITTDSAGNVGSATTGSQVFSVDNHVSLPTITFENPGPDGLYSKAEIAHGHPNTVTATITPPGDAKVGEHLVVNGQDHVLDAHTLQHGIQIEVHPGSNVQATMTDEHGNTAGSQGFAASAIPEPIIVRPPSGSHQVSGTLGVPPLAPSQTPVPSAQNGWRIHLPNGQYVTSHHGQYGTLTIDPQTGHLHYQEQAQVHTGPHGSASGIGQHEDKFEIALQGTNQDEVVAHVNVQILSHGPGHSGKLTVGTEVVDMTITPIVHASPPAPPPPPPVQHDEPEIASHEDFTFTVSEDTSLDLSQHAHQESDQKTDHHGAAAYLDALGIQPDASPSTGHDQPADMDIVLAQVDQQHAVDYDQAHLDMSDALEHHDAANNHNQDDEHHHHNDLDGLPDIDPNN